MGSELPMPVLGVPALLKMSIRVFTRERYAFRAAVEQIMRSVYKERSFFFFLERLCIKTEGFQRIAEEIVDNILIIAPLP